MKIFGLILSCMFVAGCGDDEKKNINSTKNSTIELTQENLEKAAVPTSEESVKPSSITVETNSSAASESSLEPAKNVADELNATAKQASENIEPSSPSEGSQEAPNEAPAVVAATDNNASDNSATSEASGVLFPGNKTVTEYYAMKCRVCHGAKAEKNTMDPTHRVMAGLPKDELYNAMITYQNGGGGKLKATMLGQIKALNNEQIEALAELISKF